MSKFCISRVRASNYRLPSAFLQLNTVRSEDTDQQSDKRDPATLFAAQCQLAVPCIQDHFPHSSSVLFLELRTLARPEESPHKAVADFPSTALQYRRSGIAQWLSGCRDV